MENARTLSGVHISMTVVNKGEYEQFSDCLELMFIFVDEQT